MSYLPCPPWRLAAVGLTLMTGLLTIAQAQTPPEAPAGPAEPATPVSPPLVVTPVAPAAPVSPASPAPAATPAKTIIGQAAAAQQALQALSATMNVQTTGQGADQSQTITLAFRKPDMAKAAVSDKTGPLAQIVSDGKTLTIYDVHAKQYVREPLPAGTSAIVAVLNSAHAILPMMIARPEGLAQNFASDKLKATISTDTLNGTAVDVLSLVPPTTAGQPQVSIALSIGHEDHLLRRISETLNMVRDGKTQTVTHTETITDFSISPTQTAADFAFTPPPGVKKIAPQPAQAQSAMYDKRLKPGARPFAIATKDIAGKPISLAQYRGKVVLMDFWATWCGPCVGEMPNVIAAYKKYHAQGFDVLGISLDQDKGALTAFIKQNKMPWRQVFDGKGWGSAVPRQYGVMAIPFGLLIGRDGKIVGVEVRGPDLAPAIQQALARKQASAQ